MKQCPYCKTENRDSARFCAGCRRMIDNSVFPAIISLPVSIDNKLAPASRWQGSRYVVKEALGQGEIGSALLAVDNRVDNRLVVIKELIVEQDDYESWQDDIRNLQRDVEVLARVHHPLAPVIIDYFREGSRLFMVQEYVEGENLLDCLHRLNHPLQERDVLIYASDLLDILGCLSQRTASIVHCDIKPANIIIGARDKHAHLVNFSIAHAEIARNNKRKQTPVLGTHGYAAPELYQGNANPSSDLYALGATLYHVLTNRDPRNYPPFSYPPVRSLNSGLSPETEQVLTRSLYNNISQRYRSAGEMKRDIDHILWTRYGVSEEIGHTNDGPAINRRYVPGKTDSTMQDSLQGKSAKPTQMLKLFYCYAHQDKALRDELEKHLSALQRSGRVTGWYDREIQAGTGWEHEIEKQLNTSAIILLLVSADFIFSDYCYSVEMQKALELHRAGRARVIPILLRPVDWEETPLAELQMLPTEAKPITSWENRDEAFEDVARNIRSVVKNLLTQVV